MHPRRAKPYAAPLLLVVILIASVPLVAGCGSSGASSGGSATASTTPTTAVAETTTGPEPISAVEEEWVSRLHQMEKRLEKIAFLGGVVTRARLLSQAKAYRRCERSLGAEPSDRFAPAFEAAVKACKQFARAAAQLRRAAGAIDASGAVESGTPAERTFNRSFERGSAAAGNAINTLLEAISKADTIKASLPS